MIAAAVLAAGLLAPSGVTAAIQADPVCLPASARPGHSYPLSVYVSGSGPLTLAVTPAHGTLERSLHQVPGSWVRFAANPAGPGQVALTLAIPGDAAAGAYWSDINATTQPGSGQAGLGTAATTAIVFAVGPSVPPPPCDALDLAQSTGRYPAWPTEAFATTGWKQVFAEQQTTGPKPFLSPTASPHAPAVKASPLAYTAARVRGYRKPPKNWQGWAVLAGAGVLILAVLRKWLRG